MSPLCLDPAYGSWQLNHLRFLTQRRWDRQSKRLRRPDIDDHLEPDGLFDGQITRLCRACRVMEVA